MSSFEEIDFDAGLLSFVAGWRVFSDFGDVTSFEDKQVVALLIGNSNNNARDIVPSLANAYKRVGSGRLAVVYLCEHSECDLGAQDRAFESGMPAGWVTVRDEGGGPPGQPVRGGGAAHLRELVPHQRGRQTCHL